MSMRCHASESCIAAVALHAYVRTDDLVDLILKCTLCMLLGAPTNMMGKRILWQHSEMITRIRVYPPPSDRGCGPKQHRTEAI